ncbi:MAG: prephenate dehydratase domain-containing protein, partial [Roseovarius gahaiensis]
MTQRIAFQGEPGAYSHQACHETYPDMEAMPCRTFEDATGSMASAACPSRTASMASSKVRQGIASMS